MTRNCPFSVLSWASGLFPTGHTLKAGVYTPTSSFISLCFNNKEGVKVCRVKVLESLGRMEGLNEKDHFPFHLYSSFSISSLMIAGMWGMLKLINKEK